MNICYIEIFAKVFPRYSEGKIKNVYKSFEGKIIWTTQTTT